VSNRLCVFEPLPTDTVGDAITFLPVVPFLRSDIVTFHEQLEQS